MLDDGGWIKLSRKILSWGWFHDRITLQVWIYLLASANFKPSTFRGVKIGRGEVVANYAGIAARCGISLQNARTAINHLKSTGELTSRRHKDFQVFSIANYDLYQAGVTSQPTFNQQSSNNHLTTSKNVKKEKNKIGPKTWEKNIPAEFWGEFSDENAWLKFWRGE